MRSSALLEVQQGDELAMSGRACEGILHVSKSLGHDGSGAAFAVACSCSCGLESRMLLCAGRVQFVLDHPSGEISCGACGRVHRVRDFWVKIEPAE